jgi:hypothetical protein
MRGLLSHVSGCNPDKHAVPYTYADRDPDGHAD